VSSLAIYGDPRSGFYTQNPKNNARKPVTLDTSRFQPSSWRERPTPGRPPTANVPESMGSRSSPSSSPDMSAYRPSQSSAPDMSVYKPNPYVSQSQFNQMFSPGQAQSRQPSFGTAYRPSGTGSQPPASRQPMGGGMYPPDIDTHKLPVVLARLPAAPRAFPAMPTGQRITDANMPQEWIDAGRTPFGGIIQDGRVIGGDYALIIDSQGQPIDRYGNPFAQSPSPAEQPSAQSQGYFNMFPRQPSQVSMSGDPRGMYATAPIDQRPAPFTVDSMYGPMGETSNPFADRDAILERIMSLNMDRQMRFNQTSPSPMSPGSPFFNYGSLTAR
jgi:hypothetical protein